MEDATLIIEKDPINAIAVWMKNPADSPDDTYEVEMNMFYPGGEFRALGKTEFKFTEARPMHRIRVGIRGKLDVKQSGIMTIESKLRKKGDSGWLIQNIPIIVEFTDTLKGTKPSS